jgi:hypothetical protein
MLYAGCKPKHDTLEKNGEQGAVLLLFRKSGFFRFANDSLFMHSWVYALGKQTLGVLAALTGVFLNDTVGGLSKTSNFSFLSK